MKVEELKAEFDSSFTESGMSKIIDFLRHSALDNVDEIEED